MEEYNNIYPNFFFKTFYDWSRKRHNIIPDIKSQDKDNRKNLPNDIEIPKTSSLSKIDIDYINSSKDYVNKNFKNNYGNTDNFIYPITHDTAKKWLNEFIKNKIDNFGNYQDSIKKDESYLFHSILSSSINIGLLNPIDIIDLVLKQKSKIPLNSFEGYIRQLFWREFMRYTYLYFDFTKDEYFNNKKKLTKEWYNGTLNIEPIDDCIKKAFETGYLHHIERLMLVGNFMNLSQISSNEGFKWYMEFAIDSYDWVMYLNVYEMVFFNSGGRSTRKPYISSSNYIIKMSNYKNGTWSIKWDKLYKDFLIKNKDKLYKFRYSFPTLKNL